MSARAALRALLAASLLCVVVTDARAQSAPAGLRRRMDAFAGALREQEPMARIASFFPRDSAWEFVQAPDRAGAPVGRRSFDPGSTLAAISEGGPICDSFGGLVNNVVPGGSALVMQATESRRPWRYVGRLRFVPPGARTGSPNFVEWRRERGAWVVSRIGEPYHYSPRVIGQPSDPTRDTIAGNWLPLERRLAAGTRWYRDNETIRVARRSYTQYGRPRALADSTLERYGSLGVVPVFVDRDWRGHEPVEMIYVLVAPGEYQPYEMGHGYTPPCRE